MAKFCSSAFANQAKNALTPLTNLLSKGVQEEQKCI